MGDTANVTTDYNDGVPSIVADLTDTTATPGAFGSASEVATYTVDAKGRLTASGEVAIAITSGNITDFNEAAQDAVGGMLDDSSNVTLVYNDATPSIVSDLTNTTVTPGTYGNATNVGQFTVDAKGRITAAVDVPFSAGTGVVETIVAGDSINVDSTDPANPIVSFVTPGSDTEVLFNDGGTVGSDESFTYDKSLGRMNIGLDAGVTRAGSIQSISPDSNHTVDISLDAHNTGSGDSAVTISVDSDYIQLNSTGDFLHNGDIVWSAGNLLNIGTTAASARAALEQANGTYTPILTGVANVAASSSPAGMYSRMGDIVTVSVLFNVDPTAASVTTLLGISLPIASALTSTNHVMGTGTAIQAWGTVRADTTNDRAELQFLTADAANRTWCCTFQYRII